jgi:hypothetical protein
MTEWKPFWQPKGSVSIQRLKVAEGVDQKATTGFCEFVGDEIDPVCEGRYCSNGTFCPTSCFKDPIVFAGCTFRLEKLKSREGT